MSPTSPIIILVFLAVALLTTKLISGVFKIKLAPVKYTSIDGLRGYLAFFVFLHHSSIYYFFLSSKNWEAPPSKLYTHLGESSVSLFFMITGFLFFSKLIDARTKKIDWLRFFVSRFLRLYPLYLFVLIALLCIVYIMSNYTIIESPSQLLREIWSWFLFSTFNNPNINGYPETINILASVTWTIEYEWIFYFSLPLLGFLFFRQGFSILLIAVSSGVAFSIYYFTETRGICFYSFIGGLLAAILIKKDSFVKLAKHYLSTIIIIASLFFTACFFNSAFFVGPLILTSLAFILIACGNTIFGVLSLNVSRQFGQLAYSLYLLHTTLLFIFYRMIIGMEVANKFSVSKYWIVTLCISVVLICLSFLTYYFIELPSIRAAERMTKKIRNLKSQLFKV